MAKSILLVDDRIAELSGLVAQLNSEEINVTCLKPQEAYLESPLGDP